MIKNIIFDMGQVIIKFDPNFFIERAGITDTDDKEILIHEVFKSIEWAKMDRGTLSPEQATELIKARVPSHLKNFVSDLTCNWHKPIIPIHGAENLIKELKENGYRLFLLSNANSNHKDYWKLVPGNEFFEGTIVSCDYHLVKPQPELYKFVCEKYELKAEECVFIDDSPLNCEGAEFSGIKAIVFHGDYQEVRRKLKYLDVKVEL